MSLVIGNKDKHSFHITHHYPSKIQSKVCANDKPENLMYLSENYVRLKTIAVFIPKVAIYK